MSMMMLMLMQCSWLTCKLTLGVLHGVLPYVFDELLKPTPHALRFLNWALNLCAGLVFGELRTNKV